MGGCTAPGSGHGGGGGELRRHPHRAQQHHLGQCAPATTAGGGVANYGGTLTVTNSTISGNYGRFGYGGGVANTAAPSP